MSIKWMITANSSSWITICVLIKITIQKDVRESSVVVREGGDLCANKRKQ